MTKLEIVNSISDKIGVERVDVQAVVEAFMHEVKNSLSSGEDVFLRGFGSFIISKEHKKQVEIFLRIQRLSYQLIMFLRLSLLKNL
jgi:nucleoid DNA-binding protein